MPRPRLTICCRSSDFANSSFVLFSQNLGLLMIVLVLPGRSSGLASGRRRLYHHRDCDGANQDILMKHRILPESRPGVPPRRRLFILAAVLTVVGLLVLSLFWRAPSRKDAQGLDSGSPYANTHLSVN
jgi:hypothetical protein